MKPTYSVQELFILIASPDSQVDLKVIEDIFLMEKDRFPPTEFEYILAMIENKRLALKLMLPK